MDDDEDDDEVIKISKQPSTPGVEINMKSAINRSPCLSPSS